MSEHTSTIFRSQRSRGLSHELAVTEVYRAGAYSGGSAQARPNSEFEATSVYVAARAQTDHVNALDEVFLAGFEWARSAN